MVFVSGPRAYGRYTHRSFAPRLSASRDLRRWRLRRTLPGTVARTAQRAGGRNIACGFRVRPVFMGEI
jgi:hypothetical protein